MKVLAACEFSGRVRDAFASLGHDAWSCDLLPSDTPGNHIVGDLLDHLTGWDLIVAFPPCTHLCVSGARWWASKRDRQEQAIAFVGAIAKADCPHIAIENPVGVLSSVWRKPDQIIQPWQFGHGETKATCLWLKGLPKLTPTHFVEGRENRVHRMPPSADRWRLRSLTYQGVADAMAAQWGASAT